MKRRTPLVAVLLAFAVFCVSCSPPIEEDGRQRTIQVVKLAPKEAYAFIQKNRNKLDFVLIDIRTPGEYTDYHIAPAINIPLQSDTFEADIAKLDKDKTYMIYCRTGRRVTAAVDIMENAGFKKVYGIAGDIRAWKSEGLPLVR